MLGRRVAIARAPGAEARTNLESESLQVERSLVLLGAALREVPVIKNSRLIWVCREMADVILRAPLMGSMALVVRKALNVCLKSAKQLMRKLLAPQYTV